MKKQKEVEDMYQNQHKAINETLIIRKVGEFILK